MSRAVNITQEQAEAILQIRFLNPGIDFAPEWTVMCRGYGADSHSVDDVEGNPLAENDPAYFNSNDFTGLEPEDIEDNDLSEYWDFQLWPSTAPQGRQDKWHDWRVWSVGYWLGALATLLMMWLVSNI